MERLLQMTGVDHGDDPIQPQGLTDRRSLEKPHHRPRFCKASGLDDDVIKLSGAGYDLVEYLEQIITNSAAHTAVIEFEESVVCCVHELTVDPDITKFILDNRKSMIRHSPQDVLEERSLARAQKAGDQSDGDRIHRTNTPIDVGWSRAVEGGHEYATTGLAWSHAPVSPRILPPVEFTRTPSAKGMGEPSGPTHPNQPVPHR